MNHEIIQFIGLNELEDIEKDMVNRITTQYYQKIKRALKNIISFVVHIKQHKKSGHVSKYSIHIRVKSPKRMFESAKDADFDLARALHKSFENIETEIKHHTHSDVSYNK